MISKHDYAFEVTTDKLRLYKKLSPEERFLWLEEAHEFVINAVSTNNLTLWKQYAKGGYEVEKARLNINKTKKGGYAVTLIFASGKSLPLSDIKLQNDALNGKEVDVLLEKGQVKQIICDGNIIYDKSASAGKTTQSGSRPPIRNTSQANPRNNPSSNTVNIEEAIAPYNFVPLNDKVVPAEKIPDFDTYHPDRYTGYIDIEIETMTPLYIRDTLDDEESRERDRIDEQRKTNKSIPPYCNPDFFSPGNTLRIPGSSLRGMIRTMVEIVSFGKFGFFDERRLYYRGLADMSNLRKEYQSKMSSYDRNSRRSNYKMSAGYIYKEGLKYYIHPAKGFKQITKKEAKQLLGQKNKEYKTFTTHKMNNGYIVISGDMKNKKRDWFIELPDSAAKPILLSSIDVQDYRNDTGRHKDVPNLLLLASKDRIPCFYTRYIDSSGNERISFGHTAMFRLAYTKTIGDHIPTSLKNPNITDIAEAIFGTVDNEKSLAGRIFFEDAFCLIPKEEALMGEKTPHILSGPKPTTFQHYLEQKEENLRDHPKNLAHYNSNTNIRGYKLYWHKDGTDWQQTDAQEIQEHKSQYTKINPVKPNVKFTGRIRFENLSSVELGALLFAIDLPEGCYHKLGMAKPLGLGSIKITPKLYISNRIARYKSLSAEWIESIAKVPIADHKRAFENYIMSKLNENKKSLWEINRLKELMAMLDFQNKPPKDKTRYMEIERNINGKKENEFRNRPVLPQPTQVRRS